MLQLDADEVVSKKLANEIMEVIVMNDEEIEEYQKKLKKRNLFLKHQKIIEQRDGRVGNESKEYSAFFIPRLNFFLGKYLRYGGVYPDGVIRLVKKGKAHFPCKSVHEQIQVEGKVGWLENDLLHNADPTFKRYLERNSRYIDLIVGELKRSKAKKSLFLFIDWVLIKPLWWFLLTLIRHKGILDGIQGIIFSFFSALRFPRAYFRYITK
ncbi:MAG: Glycosyl transferase family 2 [Candidatus Daviesbacteria bacterium GW2011_GWA1_36_8]|uniref:Glycosyl transferase family 2 n=1 Tax=Candidatus Daviesbacteria bacterium GW2011_GWA1_36_8 TaxID=1618417 RepID=A0A0G0FC25_9BACT|nr:MAG: Glycosyl transferase family 2 [Candidatus Daviesbacteria bacterium GW2011_GWA1_36_8]